VTLVGAAAVGCVPATGPGHSPPDVALLLPAPCLREKDFLNRRVTAVQTLYLARVAASVTGAVWEERRPHRHAQAPALLVPGPAPYQHLRLVVSLEADAFPLAKLAPSRANLKAAAGGQAAAPSPLYNAALVADMHMEQWAATMRTAASAVPALPAACALLCAWASRRQLLHSTDGCAGGFLLRALALKAHSQGALLGAMSPHQAFRAVLRSLGKGLLTAATAAAPQHWRAAFPVVLLSSDGACNYAAHMSASAAAELEAEAGATALSLDAGGRPAADASLLLSSPQVSRYDLHICIHVAAREQVAGGGDGDPEVALAAEVHRILATALGERAKRIRVVPRSPSAGADEPLLGLVVLHSDPAVAWRVVDAGPPAEEAAKCKAFRSFWGPKAELRRFADGAITEAVVWDAVPGAARHTIPGEAALWALRRHLSIATAVTASAGCLDPSLPPGPTGSALMAAMDRLAQRLRALAALPLRVASVQPVSPAFRGCAVAAPTAHPLCGGPRPEDGHVAAVVDALEIMVQLEGSGVWPDDPQAAEQTRAAFALAIASELGSAFGMASSASSSGDVDILFEGFAFRLLVTTEADARRQLAPSPGPVHVSVQARHAAAVAGLCGTHASLAGAVRLAKRWLGCQLLGSHFADQAVELLVACGYVHPLAGRAPSSRETGFLAFLQLMAAHPWGSTAPLAIDITASQWTAAQRDAAGAQAAKGCSGGGSPLVLPTPLDATGQLWTQQQLPCMDALARTAQVARVCARRLAAGLALGGGPDGGAALVTAVMRPSLGGYDAVLALRHGSLPQPGRVLFPHPVGEAGQVLWPLAGQAPNGGPPVRVDRLPAALAKPGAEDAGRAALLVGFDPVAMLLAALRSRLSGIALVWGDPTGGSDVIAVAVRPGVRTATGPLKLSRAVCMQPGGDGGVEVNAHELAAECGSLGAGMVAAVTRGMQEPVNQPEAAGGAGKRRRVAGDKPVQSTEGERRQKQRKAGK
jgi:U3 small nucleolar RNA-associated protein 22